MATMRRLRKRCSSLMAIRDAFITADHRMARLIVLIYNWWTSYSRLTDPDRIMKP